MQMKGLYGVGTQTPRVCGIARFINCPPCSPSISGQHKNAGKHEGEACYDESVRGFTSPKSNMHEPKYR